MLRRRMQVRIVVLCNGGGRSNAMRQPERGMEKLLCVGEESVGIETLIIEIIWGHVHSSTYVVSITIDQMTRCVEWFRMGTVATATIAADGDDDGE